MITIIWFILVLGITVFIHELGHFIFAKKAGVYVYEFSLGMGPVIYKRHSKKDETDYCIRLFPIGGFVSMAGEDMETDKDIPSEKQMFNKTWIQRVLIIIAGVMFNFILAIILLFIVGLAKGVPNNKPVIESVSKDYPVYNTGIRKADTIIKLDNKKIFSSEELAIVLQISNSKTHTFTVKHKDGKIDSYKIKSKKTVEDGVVSYRYGFTLNNEVKHGIVPAIKYSFIKTYDLVRQMALIVKYLFTGKLKLNSLAGPVGIYGIVGETAKTGFINVLYLIAYLCINVGFINIIPFPAFDGGRLLFLIIEKIKGSRVKPEVENIIHGIGFVLLMLLMVFITYGDITRIIK